MAHGHKTGGRTAGTPNKVTSDVKNRIAALIEQQFDTITADLATLEPKDRVTAYLKFLEYVLPKQKEIKQEELQRVILIDDLALSPEDVKNFRADVNEKYWDIYFFIVNNSVAERHAKNANRRANRWT